MSLDSFNVEGLKEKNVVAIYWRNRQDSGMVIAIVLPFVLLIEALDEVKVKD